MRFRAHWVGWRLCYRLKSPPSPTSFRAHWVGWRLLTNQRSPSPRGNKFRAHWVGWRPTANSSCHGITSVFRAHWVGWRLQAGGGYIVLLRGFRAHWVGWRLKSFSAILINCCFCSEPTGWDGDSHAKSQSTSPAVVPSPLGGMETILLN